jgi:hypothetical protein
MVIDNTGNVGIGTTLPGTRLTVSGTGSSNTGVFSIITTGADVFNWASQAINSSMSAGRNLIHLIGQATSTNNSGYMGFSYAGASSSSNGLTFGFYGNDRLFNMLASGNMGIGTTTPSEKLTVMNGNMYLDNTGTAGELRFREPSGSGTNYTAFRAGAQAANLTYTLPTTAPTAGQLLSSDASGNLSWASAAASGWGLTGNATDASGFGATPLGQPFSSYPGTEYIGTSNLTRLYFGTNGINRGFIESGGGWSLDGAVTLSSIGGTAGTVAGSNDRILVATSAGIVNQISFAAFSAATNTSWGLTGNTTDASGFGATPLGQPFSSYPGTEYIGTSNATRLYFGTSGTNRGFVESTGGWSLDGAVTLSSISGTVGTVAGSNDRILVATSAGIINQISFASFSAATNASWGLTGNTTDASPFGAAPLGALFSSYGGTEYIGTSNATRLYFGTSGTNRGFIESTGGWSLQGPFTVTDQARFAAGTAAAPSVTRDTDTDNGMFFPAGNTVAFSTAGTERVRITDIGRVGIGNAAPAYVLDVTGDINSSTNVRAGGTALTSDARLKRNVEPIASALTVLTQLKPVQYEKKAAIDDTLYQWKQMGFIAQELKEILPDLVQVGADKYSTMSIDYTSLIALLTSAVQQQQSVIQDQGQRIRYLTALVQLFELRLKELENKLGPSTYER